MRLREPQLAVFQLPYQLDEMAQRRSSRSRRQTPRCPRRRGAPRARFSCGRSRSDPEAVSLKQRAHPFERLKLQLVVLIVGGDAGVTDEHASIVSKPTDAVASEMLVSDTSFGHTTSLLAARSARCLTDGRL